MLVSCTVVRRHSLRLALIAAAISCAAPRQYVEIETPTPLERAKAALVEANAASKAGDYAHALSAYERAYAFKQDALLVFNIGQLARKSGNLAKAHEFYSRYLQNPSPGHADVLREAHKMIALVEAAEKLLKPALAVEGLVAVLEIKVRRPPPAKGALQTESPFVTTPDTTYLTDVVRSAAADASLNVVTKENVTVLLRERGHAPESCIDQCEVDTGRLIGADYVLSGELISSDQYRLSLKLHDTVGARFLGGVQANAGTLTAVEAVARVEVEKLFVRIKAAAAAH